MRIVILGLVIQLGLSCLLSLGCQSKQSLPAHSDVASRLEEEAKIIEAVLEFQLKHFPLANGFQCYFLGTGDNQDLDDELIERMKRLGYHAKKLSETSFNNEGKATDKQTGEVGIVVKVGKVKWKAEDKVEVSGSVTTDNDNYRGFVFYVSRAVGRWSVKNYEFRSAT